MQSETNGLPIVEVEVNSHNVRFLVDTGADYHLLGSQFAESAGLAIAKTDVLAGGGETVSTKVGATNVSISSGSSVLINGIVPVAALPKDFVTRKISGVLSPQRLARPGATVVMDFVKGRLAVVDGAPTAEDAQGTGKALAPSGMKVCRPAGMKIGGRYVVQAQVAGFEGWLELDTGASSSRILANSPAGLRLAALQPSMPAVGQVAVGGRSTLKLAKDVSVRIGELAGKVDAVLVPGAQNPACPTIGAIGMDVLRYCVIALDSNGGMARCSPNQGNGS